MGPSYPAENRLFKVTAHDHLRSVLRSTRIACDYREKITWCIFFKKVCFFNYLPLQIWTLKICNHDIWKSIKARSFNLCQLIEDDE